MQNQICEMRTGTRPLWDLIFKRRQISKKLGNLGFEFQEMLVNSDNPSKRNGWVKILHVESDYNVRILMCFRVAHVILPAYTTVQVVRIYDVREYFSIYSLLNRL